MTTEDVKRKLTAIFSADVQGYSRLMGDDERATVETISAYRKVMTDLIHGHNGRVVDAKGDNVLAEFPSVVDAIQCAVEIQKELKGKNANLSEHRRMEFRIGINLGDVIEKEETIYGDGVNIAARLESLAEGGGICISGTAFDQIGKKVPLGYEYLGEQTVKNIENPIRVYKALVEPETVGKVIGKEKPKPRRWRWAAIGGVAVLIILAAVFAVWNFYLRPPQIEPASVEKMAFPLPDKPSIAILPFDNLSGDPEQEYIADGITENITSALAKIPEIFVIARNSAFIYKGKPVKVQKVSEEFGVRYVLEGSVQKSEDRIRVTAQLIDATKGHHLWSEQYDRDMKDLFALQDDITKEIVVALQVELTEGEQARLRHRSTDNFKAWGYAVKGYSHFQRYNKADNAKARELFEEATKLDPDYAWAWTWLAWTYWIDARFGFSQSRSESFKRAIEVAQKAVALDESNPQVHALLESIYLFQRQYGKAIAEGERAILLGPNNAEVHSLLAMTMFQAGRFEEAVVLSEKAMRLSPFYPSWYLLPFGASNLFLGQYEKAIEAFKKCLERAKKEGGAILIFTRCYLAAAYIELDREEEAHSQVEEIFKINPKFSLEWVRKASFWKDPEQLQRFLDDLRKAGIPEKPPLPLPDKPSIAVLPFANISGDPKEDYLSDGITEQIITALSKTPKLFIIARNSVFTYKGKPVMVQQVSEELGVRYVLEGSVQKSGDRIRITAQLIDAKTGNHLWAEKFDRDLKDIFELQDDIAMNVITALQLKLTEGEQARIYGRHTNNIDAYLNLLQAREHMFRHNKQDFLIAKRLLKEAIALDPNYTAPYEFLGLIHLMEVMWGWSPSPGESLNQAFELSQKILKIDSSNGPVHGLLSNFYSVKKQFGKAISEAEKFVALDPNNADAYAIMGWALYGAGKFKDSISPFDKAIALNPIPPTWYRNALGWATYFIGLFDEANAVFRKLLIFYPKYGPGYYGLGCTLIAVGKPEEAVVELDKALRNPGWEKSNIIGTRAIALVMIGQPDEAITTMQDLVSRRPDDVRGYGLFSFVLRLEGRHEEALQMAKKAVSLRQGRLETVILGMSYFMLEQYDQAIAEFKKSIKLWPDCRRPHVWLAAAFSLTDRMEDARAEVAEVLRINPKTSLEDIAKNGWFNYKEGDKERFSNALRKAGLK